MQQRDLSVESFHEVAQAILLNDSVVQSQHGWHDAFSQTNCVGFDGEELIRHITIGHVVNSEVSRCLRATLSHLGAGAEFLEIPVFKLSGNLQI